MPKHRKEDPLDDLPLFTKEYLDFLQTEQLVGPGFVACHRPVEGVSRRVLSSVQLEVSPIEGMPRILVDPNLLRPKDLSVKRLQADAAQLHDMVTSNPDGFEKLIELVNDPEGFVHQAKHLGLTETDFARQGGGFIEELVIFLAALTMTGCSGSGGTSSAAPVKCVVNVTYTPSAISGGATIAQDYSITFSFTPSSNLHPVDHNNLYGWINYDKSGVAATATLVPKERVAVTRGSGTSPTTATVTLPFDIYPPGTTLFIKYAYACPTCRAYFEANTSVKMP